MNRAAKILVILFLIATALYFSSYVVLAALGGYLTPVDPLEPADIIVVLSGGPGRAEWGIKLYEEAWAPRILFSGAARDPVSISNAQSMRATALAAGVPDGAIFTEDKSVNTYQNAVNSKVILDKIGAQTIILVTAPYHQRRALETFVNVFSDRKIKIINSPSGYSDWSAKAWWERPGTADVGWGEILRLLWAKLTGEYF